LREDRHKKKSRGTDTDRDAAVITFVLDESGSMRAIEDAAREGFNEFLEEQIEHGGTTWWSLTTFNSQARVRFKGIPGAEVRPLGPSDYSPGGLTALLDALGDSIQSTQRQLTRRGRSAPNDVIVVVMTDGMENASVKWTRSAIFDLITECEQAGWQFIFLGANQESWAVANDMGMRRAAVVDFAHEDASSRRAWDEAKLAARDYRASKVQQSKYRDHREHRDH
jgi:Mg-chelatase subunit ChlD